MADSSLGGARVQRSSPRPFQRPRVEIGGSPQTRRQWQMIPAHRLAEGDIVPDLGRVTSVEEAVLVPRAGMLSPQQIADGISWTITVRGGADHVRTYQGGDLLYAFTPVPDPEEAG